MANQSFGRVLHHVRELVAAQQTGRSSDRDLLERFRMHHDEAAFAALVRRHGPMVLGVCRRVLRHVQDAEDASQAAFLVLARKAGSIRKAEAVGSWLYGVAYRVARKLQAQVIRRKTHSTELALVSGSDNQNDASWKEFLAVLDEELNRLPLSYRAPLVLCYLQGHTQDQAARQLDWSLGKLRGQLERGREVLRSRLARRGMSLSAALLAVNLVHETASAAPALLAGPLAAAAVTFAAGGVPSGTAVRAAILARGVARGMTLTKLHFGSALILVLTMVGVGAALTAQSRAPAQTTALADTEEKRDRAPVDKVIGTDRGRDPLPLHAFARLGSERFRHGGVIWAVRFALNGKTLASTGTDHSIRLWDAVTGRSVGVFADPGAVSNPYLPSRWLFCLAFAPDGKTVAAGEYERGWQFGNIHLWDITTGKKLLKINAHQRGVLDLAFSPNGKFLASAGADRAIRLWETATGKQILALAGHTDLCCGIAFTGDGKGLVSMAADGTVRGWDRKTGQERWRIAGQFGGTGSMAVSADGKILASVGKDNTIGVYNADKGKQVRRLRGLPANLRRLAFSRNGKILAVATANGAVHLWDPAASRQLRALPDARGEIHSLAFAKDDKTLAAARGAAAIARWDIATGKPIPPPGGHEGPVGSLAFSQGGKTLVSGGWDWTVRLWEAETGKQLACHPAPQIQGRTVALARDGKLLAVARKGGGIVLVDAHTGKERRRIAGHKDDVVTLAFGPRDKTLASAGMDKTVRLWNLATGQELHVLVHDHPVMHLAYALDGKLLVSSTRQRMVHVWNAVTGKEIRQLEHAQPIHSIALATDDRTLAAGGADGMVVVWDAPSGRVLHRLGPHAGYVVALAFAPDGRTLAVGNWRETRVWELATGKERTRLPAHWGDITALAFGPNGRTLATASSDTTILIWDLTGRRGVAGRPPAAKLTPAELGRSWKTLGDQDAAKAGQALWTLVMASHQAVPFLKDRLAGQRAPVDAKRIAGLIADLDNDNFSVRERAETELQDLGPAIKGALDKALEGTPPVEVQVRVTRLLKRLAARDFSPGRLRVLRALEILELTGTPAARQLLQALSKGADGDEVSRQAQGSIARLAKRRSGSSRQ
jgi:RNA polymerase sigma factor (sigma-70 family)